MVIKMPLYEFRNTDTGEIFERRMKIIDKEKYLSTLNFDYIHTNPFDKIRETFIEKEYNKYLMAYRIQQYWNKAYSIPTNPICQRKQKRDYEKCSGILFC